MKAINKLNVDIELDSENIEIGELVISNQKIYFKYKTSFLDRGIDISPFKLPLTSEILTTNEEPFEGLFGVFNDSLPDGWGKLLLDRMLTTKGITISEISPLTRLAFVGENGAGALKYRPKFENTLDEEFALNLDEVAREMSIILEGQETEILDQLYQMGGSSGGVRPKINVLYNPNTGDIKKNTINNPDGYEPWIIKFPSSSDFADIANIEFAYYNMAKDAGIKMSSCKLLKGNSGKNYFGTKRFDRIGNNRLHLHSASGLMHDNFRASTMDYGHLMDCAFRLEKHVDAYSKILRLAAFNVFTHNKDDHSKNFSFLMDEKGEWRFAPAYDLTFSYSAYGHHSTMVAGESKSPGEKHLMELANHFGVKDAKKIIEEVREVVNNWKMYAKDAGLSSASANRIAKALF